MMGVIFAGIILPISVLFPTNKKLFVVLLSGSGAQPRYSRVKHMCLKHTFAPKRPHLGPAWSVLAQIWEADLMRHPQLMLNSLP